MYWLINMSCRGCLGSHSHFGYQHRMEVGSYETGGLRVEYKLEIYAPEQGVAQVLSELDAAHAANHDHSHEHDEQVGHYHDGEYHHHSHEEMAPVYTTNPTHLVSGEQSPQHMALYDGEQALAINTMTMLYLAGAVAELQRQEEEVQERVGNNVMHAVGTQQHAHEEPQSTIAPDRSHGLLKKIENQRGKLEKGLLEQKMDRLVA